jgi:integrase
MVAMLIGCGLRRAELLALRLESIEQREEHWVIADLVGKGGHVRTVPIPNLGEEHRGRVDGGCGHHASPGVPRDQQRRACLGRWQVAEGAMGCGPLRGGSRRD